MPDGRSVGAGLVLTGLALAVWGFGDRDSNETHTVDAQIGMVELDMKSGDVRIETGDVDRTTVREHREYWLMKTGESYKVTDGKLVLDGDCGWQCTADFVVTVPRGSKVTGETGSGDVVLEGLGDIDVESGSGNVTATDAAGAVTIDIASGDLTVDGAAGPVDLETKSGEIKAGRLTGGQHVQARAASGDIELDLDAPAQVTADGRSGDISVRVPEGSYNVEADTRSGDTDVQVASSPEGTHLLKLDTASGDVEVSNG
ncbi:MAG: DUF4097 family beta strand repeat-containing protein [Kribbellaceae bacterium]|nr:DUF4097 family beta strand repeat-containing protein [Kribbellaceae bacterium]